MKDVINEYIEKGWTAPLPLPHNAKFPPPKNMTGNIPPLTREDIETAWKRASNNANIGIRSQIDSEMDVIFIDVDEDQAKGKYGAVNMTALQKQYGDLHLQEIPRSSRRGPDSLGAQYPFLVPAGVSWQGQAGKSIDVIQFKHRYTVVSPSTVDGMQYQWYIGNEVIDIPHIDDLPTLPDKWVNFLSNGSLKSGVDKRNSSFAKQVSEYSGTDQYDAAINWMRDNLPEYGSVKPMSNRMRAQVDTSVLMEEMSENAHDTLLNKTMACIELSAEGHDGLKQALKKLRDAFYEEVLSKGRRTKEDAKSEFERAIIGGVARLSAEIDSGRKKIIDYDAIEITPFRSASASVDTKVDTRGFDLGDPRFDESDAGSARLFSDFWGQNVLATNVGRDQEFAVWSELDRRFNFHAKNQMYRLVEQGVSDRIKVEIGKLKDEAEALQARMNQGQLPPKGEDDLDPDEILSYAAKLKNWADRAKSTTGASNILAQTHSDPTFSVNISEFNTQFGIIGLQGGLTLDTKALEARETYIRPSVQADMLTMSAKTTYEENAYHGAWEKFLDQFLPEPEIRRFVQKVLGYTLREGNARKIMVFLVGDSNTGKTTILEACGAALGDYATNMNANKLLKGSDGGPSPELVNNAGKLMVFLSEVGNTHELSADAIKQVTGGDTIQARELYSNDTAARRLRFTPYASTNTPPQITGGDAALRDRIVALPFTHVNKTIPAFEMNVVDNEAVRPAILGWLIEGLEMYRDEGLNYDDYPAEVKALIEDFISETSYLSRFLKDSTVEYDYPTREEKAKRPDIEKMYGHFRNWAAKNHLDRRDIMDMVAFQRDIIAITKNKTAVRTKKNKKNVWVFNLKLV